MSIYEDLLVEYDKGKEKVNRGEDVNKLELMFVGYALDAVDTAKRNFKTDLDFSEESIKSVENILDQLNKTLKSAKPSIDTILSFAKQFAGYMGQVIRIQWGGQWVDENEYSIKNGPALRTRAQDLFLLSKVYRRITTGQEDNVWHFYCAVKSDIGGTNDLGEVKIEELAVKEKKGWLKKLLGR